MTTAEHFAELRERVCYHLAGVERRDVIEKVELLEAYVAELENKLENSKPIDEIDRFLADSKNRTVWDDVAREEAAADEAERVELINARTRISELEKKLADAEARLTRALAGAAGLMPVAGRAIARANAPKSVKK